MGWHVRAPCSGWRLASIEAYIGDPSPGSFVVADSERTLDCGLSSITYNADSARLRTVVTAGMSAPRSATSVRS